MKIEFTGRGFEVTQDIKEHTSSKMNLINKLLNNVHDVSVVLSTEKYRHKAEIKFLSNKQIFHGQEETAEMLQSIDRVIEKLEKQVRRFKQKKLSTKRNTSSSIKMPVDEPYEVDHEEREINIFRVDNYQVKPMDLEEAVEEVTKLQQDFIVFRKADTNAITVLYQRKDGHYGYIEP